MAQTHELKILPQYYKAAINNTKNFEIRKNDRNYQVGDTLILREWDGEKYTGRSVSRYVCYIYYGCGDYGLADGYCVMGLKMSCITATLD